MAASWSALISPVLPVILCVFAAAVGLLYHAELRVSTVRVRELATYGMRCVGFGVVVTAATGAGGIALTLWQPGLLNAWDQAFLGIAMGFQHIGVFLYLYYSVPLAEWASGSHSVQLKQLELIWDQQKMLLRAFFVLIVTVLVGQVFGVMRLKYGNIWEDATRLQQETPHILLSAAQLAFLILEWWALVLARVLRRMEQVLLRLGDLTDHA